jgi:hypothetical protein
VGRATGGEPYHKNPWIGRIRTLAIPRPSAGCSTSGRLCGETMREAGLL